MPTAPASDYYKAVADYYDQEAPTFEQRGLGNLVLRRVRDHFRAMTDLYPAQTLLDVGCGPGQDLVYWAQRRPQAQVYGLDISPAMAREARRTAQTAGLVNVQVAVGSVEDLARLFPGVRFEMIYCYFGALNTVQDLARAARCLWESLAPGGVAVLTFVNRWFIQEIVWYLLSGRWRRAVARLRPVWGGYSFERHLASRCYSRRQVMAAFAPLFRPVHREGYSILYPAWYREKWVRRLPRLGEGLWRADRCLRHTPFWSLGEYALYALRPRPAPG